MFDVHVAVSDGAAAGVCASTGIPRGRVVRIYNGEAHEGVLREARAPVAHPCFQPATPPVILSVARLAKGKNLALLLRAFARVRRERSVRLVILGEGPQRAALDALARDLGIGADVDFPGFVENPYPYMARSGVFALSSNYEGCPYVIVQALAVGCPVVSTDCPGRASRTARLRCLWQAGARRRPRGPCRRVALRLGRIPIGIASAAVCNVTTPPPVW